VVEQSNEFLIENHETCPIGSASFEKVNPATFDLYFMVVIVIMDMVIKEILKTHFITRIGTLL